MDDPIKLASRPASRHVGGPILDDRDGSTVLGGLASKTVADVGGLVRAELDLVKAEALSDLRQAGRVAGALGVTVFALYLGAVLLVFAAAWALALVLPTGAAFAIIGGALVLFAGPLLLVARRRLRRLEPFSVTRSTLHKAARLSHNTKR
ncbi:MAG: phage holin family protein [Acidimicrobiales bacterium]